MRRPLRFTRFGGLYIAFSLAVGAAAINTGNNLLYLMLGLLLGFIIISGILSDSCLWGMRAEFQPTGDLYAGQPSEWEIVAHKNWFPGVIIWAEATWPTQVTRHLFYWVPRYGSRFLRFSLTPERRGRLPLKSVRYSTNFPFGLFEKSYFRPSTQSWVVFPRIQQLSLKLLQAAGLQLSDQPANRKGWGVMPFDLREYHSGDSSKRIHWKSSAKRGMLMVTDSEEESSLSQNVYVAEWPRGESLEAFVSFVASLLFTLSLQGERIGLRTPGHFFPTDRGRPHLKSILTYLALLDPAQEPATLASEGRHPRAIDAIAAWKKVRPQLPL